MLAGLQWQKCEVTLVLLCPACVSGAAKDDVAWPALSAAWWKDPCPTCRVIRGTRSDTTSWRIKVSATPPVIALSEEHRVVKKKLQSRMEGKVQGGIVMSGTGKSEQPRRLVERPCLLNPPNRKDSVQTS